MSRKDVQEEIKSLITLLSIEKEADLRQYQQKMMSTSFKDRRKDGVCWYPVSLLKTRYDAGERLIVRVSRAAEHDDAHSFQSGKLVSLFSCSLGLEHTDDSVNGIVNSVTKQEMLITLSCDQLPQWVHQGSLGVQLLFDENSYREMEKTIHFLAKTKDQRVNELKNILLGNAEASFASETTDYDNALNESQNKALSIIHNANDLAIIHGPPGTGKTTTLVQSISHTLRKEKQVLVCAPSNAAVDLLAERLSNENINVLRLGHPARVNETMLSLTLDTKIVQHKDFKELKKLRKSADEMFVMANKYKRSFGHSERVQRNAIKSEARQLKEAANQLEFYIVNDILSNAEVITSTLVGANNHAIKGMTFETVFIDEAAQSLEPACWIPILKAERVILAGDHCQLPPTIKSYEAANKGLSTTLFEKSIKRNQNAQVILLEQYRMNRKIMEFASRTFYDNSLIANEKVANWKVYEEDKNIEFIDTAGCGFFESINEKTKSQMNQEEAHLLIKHLTQYIDQLKSINQIDQLNSIGVISPYKAQVELIKEHLSTSELNEEIANKISVNTIDSFQGQEKDVVYISLVRSNSDGTIGFLSNTRRMNVAITRARKKMVVIGDSATICQHEYYDQFLEYINEIDAYHSAFEWMY